MGTEGERTDGSAIAAELRAWYDGYYEVFTGLGRGERADIEALLAFYAAPLTLAAEGGVTAFPVTEAVLELARGLIAQLRQADYAGSETHRLEVRPLHARAALIEGVFSRQARRLPGLGLRFDPASAGLDRRLRRQPAHGPGGRCLPARLASFLARSSARRSPARSGPPWAAPAR